MRLIDADALNKKLCETTTFIKDGEAFQRMINDAPTVSAEAVHKPDYSYEADMFKRLRQAEALQADWIPITELEPNTSDHVLVTYRWGDDDYEVSEMDYWITKYEAENGNAQCKRLIDNVIAWRYMLAPYKGGGSE